MSIPVIVPPAHGVNLCHIFQSEVKTMLCFEVSLNGEVICTAGVGDYGLLLAHLMWIQCRPEEQLEPDKEWRDGRVELRMSAVANHTHVDWLNGTVPIKMGDVVSVKVVECDEPDYPTHIHRNTDPETAKNHKLELCA